MTTEATEWAVISQPEAVALNRERESEKTLKWPLGAGSEEWDGVEDEDGHKMRSSVVEKQAVTQPRRIFEEIFGLDE